MPSVLYLADQGSPDFEERRTSIDVVCAGDSITGWNNFRRHEKDWPLCSYPEFLKNSLPLVVTVAFSVVGVAGDYLLKLASEQKAPLRSGWFYLGFAVYASTAFGWVYVMRHLKLATIGAVYSVSMILLLTGVGVAAFRQPLNAYEVAGLGMAIGSLVLLMRFA
jgi:multidrug transporter EmrE-like cation transporter